MGRQPSSDKVQVSKQNQANPTKIGVPLGVESKVAATTWSILQTTDSHLTPIFPAPPSAFSSQTQAA